METKTPLVSVISYPCSDFSSLFLELREKAVFENVHLKPQWYEDRRSRIANPTPKFKCTCTFLLREGVVHFGACLKSESPRPGPVTRGKIVSSLCPRLPIPPVFTGHLPVNHLQGRLGCGRAQRPWEFAFGARYSDIRSGAICQFGRGNGASS